MKQINLCPIFLNSVSQHFDFSIFFCLIFSYLSNLFPASLPTSSLFTRILSFPSHAFSSFPLLNSPNALSPFSFQLTETSSRYARKISGTTALQEALKEKQQHIEQLLAERDLERAEMAKATSHICEVEKELSILKAQHVQVRNKTR